jgi:DnaK suppressor protein
MVSGIPGGCMAMNKDRLDYFKKFLTNQLDTLVSEAMKTVEDMSDEEETFPDPTDRASLESDRNFLLRIRDRERKLIVKINEALARIEAGTFGICEMCGEDISEERLKARPVTTLCIDCKTEEEEKEKIGS